MSEAAALADIMRENRDRVGHYVTEATENSNLPVDKTEALLQYETEFVGAVDQVIDILLAVAKNEIVDTTAVGSSIKKGN